MSQAPVNDAEALYATKSESGYLKNIEAVNGMMHRGKSFSGHERNCVFLNRGDGTFSTISAISGWDYPDDSRGLALMDWDHDGRVDFWSSNRTAPRIRMMHNTLPDTGNWIGFSLAGTTERNRDAIGARVKLELSNGRQLLRTLRAGEGFASQSSKRLNFGLVPDTTIESLKVCWPNGEWESFPVPASNAYYELKQGAQKTEPLEYQKAVFRDQSENDQLASNESGQPTCELSDSAIRAPLRISIPAPPVRFQSGGREQVLEMDQLERPLLICLWSQSCAICRTELTQFAKQAEQLKSELDIVALNIDASDADRKAANQFLRDSNYPWKFGVPNPLSNELLAAIATHSFPLIQDLPTPSSLLISRDGEIVAIYKGAVSLEQLQLDARALAGLGISQQQRLSLAAPAPGRWIVEPEKINLLYIPRLLLARGPLDDAAKYTVRAHKKLLYHKEYPILLNWIGDEHLKLRNSKRAMAFYKSAAQVGPNNAVVLNNVAWHLATCPEKDLRDGKMAVQHAERAVQLSRQQEPGYLDTLAAAHAEAGDFDSAIVVALKAIKLAQDQNKSALVESLKQSIQKFQARQPIR